MGLRGYRLRAGLTQAELARIAGTTQAHVSEYENGTRRLGTMPAERFLRMARALDVDPWVLLTGETPGYDGRVEAEYAVARARRRYARRPSEAAGRELLRAELWFARSHDA